MRHNVPSHRFDSLPRWLLAYLAWSTVAAACIVTVIR